MTRALRYRGAGCHPVRDEKLLQKFVAHCRAWYACHPQRDHCCEARQDVYAALVRRHGADSVRRHVLLIRAALDRAEAEVKAAAAGGTK